MTLINAKITNINNKKCINLNLKDNENQFKFASIWNVDNGFPAICSTNFEDLLNYIKPKYNATLSLNLSKKEIKKNGKTAIYLNIKNIINL